VKEWEDVVRDEAFALSRRLGWIEPTLVSS
jgi:hypothetical protein